MPYIFQSAGWVMYSSCSFPILTHRPSIVAILTCLISILGSAMICEAMRLVKGNERFRGRIEFAGMLSVRVIVANNYSFDQLFSWL
jgi:hypothetical protein